MSRAAALQPSFLFTLISFIARTVPNVLRDRSRVRAWLSRLARDHGTRIDNVAFVFMRDRELLHYNRTFLQHEDLTDVITFPSPSNNGLSGDILISLDRVKENAHRFDVSVQQELRRVMVHGLLHLCGHTDRNASEKAEMRKLEDHYLKLLSKER